ncbi:bifunctional phosphopantothenoylcysteine decarboxylase/phosphopantothenate--cysteine ligase CoaBC [Methanobrevibacter sp. TMH8]|uniref:bifunctional phosphopantothenoylcysteine decarboxylase/phosphopantothenate--cysteine ligase CoaBC n=1 Tax=Methanobrevibacter sp. TMH8 TaxID=2848611 RepID=UPI001CCC56BD|nr:bifunctional phosphopantothenoylcysteine decarboxylase/phosphopantothenate--cysteine ligase CoaBC [Methanobrevibacter sp. TMH8]MBZ9571414.1 bifunctional phosphopantothenoylcysteine decarboxylase/phosphopantothenate--cysteine ligase CoaBC [Methanobrevibacter sp. TMH8]
MDIILCVTGSIAATESIKLARELKRQGFNVKSFMSDAGTKIIHPNSMEFATGQDVVLDITGKIEHVKYAKADLILVAPATANVISKFAYKIADNLINTLLITAHGHDTPILFVPSMHDSMYKSISKNIEKIRLEESETKIDFVKPRMEEGKAKFPSIEDIILESKRIISLNQIEKDPSKLANKKILISLGGTYEAIDPIRGITNKSSGKMGLELAKEAYIRGMDVKLIVGTVDVKIPKCFDVNFVESSEEMNNITKELINDFDIFIATAAVSDFAPINKENYKISSSIDLSLEFKPTEKIIKQIKQTNPNIFLVGFKAEYDIDEDKMINLAKKQIEEVGTDLVIANDVSIRGCGFGSDVNQVILVDNDVVEISECSKKEIAKIVFDKLDKDL